MSVQPVQPVLTDWNIDDWLGGLGLDQYVEVFVDNGYDIPNLVASLSEKDLDVMHVNDREHRKQLLKEAANVPADKPPPKPKRTRGASVLKKMSAPDIEGTAEGLTRLQLKLKVGSELKNHKVEITALPYITEDGHPDTVSLCNLSKKYAAQFEVKVEDVYNTILDIWRIRREAEAGKTISIFSQDHQTTTPIASPDPGGPTENYDEIFDLALDKKPVRVRRKMSGEHTPVIVMSTSPTSAMVSDIQPPKSAQSFIEEEETPEASETHEVSKKPTSDDPVRRTNAIRTVSNCSSSGSQKTASGGHSTDSDLSSPDGSPETARKKRIWERMEKDKESYADVKDSRSADDIVKKSKKKKQHFLWRMTRRFFPKARFRTTEFSEFDKPSSETEGTEGHLMRASSLPALTLENAGDSFENYSQPFDSIAQVSCSPPTNIARQGPPIPIVCSAKQMSTLPSGFSPLHLRKSPTLDNSLLEPAQLNGNLNCCLDRPHPTSLPESTHKANKVRVEPILESMPEVPPRNYTPPPSDNEEPLVPPRQDDYLVVDDHSKMSDLRSRVLDIKVPPHSQPEGSSPIPVQVQAANHEKPQSKSLPPVSSNDIPPPKPARTLRASTDFSSPQRSHIGVSAVQGVGSNGVEKEANTSSKAATHRRRPPPKPPVVMNSVSESPIAQQTQVVHSFPAASQAGKNDPTSSGSPSPSLSVAQPKSGTADPTGPPKPPRAMPMSASVDDITSSTCVCYKGDSLVSPLSQGTPVTDQMDYSPALPLKPRLRGMTQPSTNSKAPLPPMLDGSSIQTSSKPVLRPKPPPPPLPPKSPHVRSLSPWLPRPHSAGAALSQELLSRSTNDLSRISPVPHSSSPQPPASLRARGLTSCTPPLRATERALAIANQRGLVTRPSIPPKPTLRWKSPPPDERRSSIISDVEAKLEEENISLSEDPFSTADGNCGIPPLLVSRYAKEMRESPEMVGEALDFVRLRQLQQLGRMAVASSPNYWCSNWSVDSSSVNAWLTSIGLPMYVERFAEAGFTMVAHLSQLKDSHYKQLDLNDPLHKEFIVEGLKRLAK